MTTDGDGYDVFLDNWEPGRVLKYAALESNLDDPLASRRLFDSGGDAADVPRTAYTPGVKSITDDEHTLKRFKFFSLKQNEWAAEFNERVLKAGIGQSRLDAFVRDFATDWVDGRRRRQNSSGIQDIKAAIHQHDLFYHPLSAGKFVLCPIDANAAATFTPDEMKAVFDINANLLDALIPDYLDCLDSDGPSSINEIYVRRGVYMPSVPKTHQELHYLSSYSLAQSLTENFAQTWTPEARGRGVPCIFSAPLPAVQKRVVAFAPFIQGMSLGQMEMIVAPPIEVFPLLFQGEYGKIREYGFS